MNCSKIALEKFELDLRKLLLRSNKILWKISKKLHAEAQQILRTFLETYCFEILENNEQSM
jgi:hypothetical protein